jgi:1-phosphatidylinositol-3-phosphate 5-kinase
VAWQQDFDRLPKPRAAQIVDRSGRRSSAFGSVRSMWPRRYEPGGGFDHPNMPSFSVSEAEEGAVGMRRVTGESFTSSASEASEPEAESTSTDPPIEASAPTTSSSENLPISSTEVLPSVLPSVTGEKPPQKSDPESDSTIAAAREDGIMSDRLTLSPPQVSCSHTCSWFIVILS